MATIQQLLAGSLDELHKLQEANPHVVLKGTGQISRTHLRRLLDHGWLQEVMKGWYILSCPGSEGDTTVWYTSYWRFILNAMLASGGYPWTIVPVESRKEYMDALEKASVHSDISDFTKVIARLVSGSAVSPL